MARQMAIAATFLLGLYAAGCLQPNEPTDLQPPTATLLSKAPVGFIPHVTGDIQFEWKGGNGSGSPDISKFAFASLSAHEGLNGNPPKGEFTFWVQSGDGTVHRTIVASVMDVDIGICSKPKSCPDGTTTTEEKVFAWVLARVASDTKGCGGGSGPGGHESGCSGAEGGSGCSDHPDGGCSAEESGHDEGCSGSGGSGGMGGPGDMGGGCGGHEGSDPGGCSGGGTDHGGGSDMGGAKGPGVSGRYCRVGQFVYIKVHDGETPAADGDGMKWKWFSPLSTVLSDWQTNRGDICFEPKLCKKTILAGNLSVHLNP